jgi:6-phosphogluconolactonase (cycloisomerase 2 family)
MKDSKGAVFWALTFLMPAALALPESLTAQGNFVYTNDEIAGPNTVSGFSVASNGTLTLIPGSPFPTGGTGATSFIIGSNNIAVSAVGNFLFASNTVSNDVSVFTINTSTGTLSLVAGSPFPTGVSSSSGIALSPTPDGKFLMAGNNDSASVTVFSIASSGALTAIPGSPFPTAGFPVGITVSADGKFLAVTEALGGSESQIEMFSIGSDGSVTSVGGFFGSGVGGLAGVDINCASSLLYAGEDTLPPGSNIVDGYSITSNGTLIGVPGSPFKPGVGMNSSVVLLNHIKGKKDKILFVSNQNSNTITVFSVSSKGTLSLVAGSPFPMNSGGIFPLGMATSQDGGLFYVADGFFGDISVFSVSNKGALTEVAESPFSTGQFGEQHSLTAFPPRACK